MTRAVLRKLLRTLGRALRLVWESAPRLATAQSALAIVQALLPLVTLLALKRAVDAAALVVATHPASPPAGLAAALNTPATRSVLLWLMVGAGALGVQATLRALAAWIAEQHAMAVSDRVHAQLHAQLLAVDLAFFEDASAQDRLHLVQDQAMTQPVRALGSLFQALHASVALLGVLALLAAIHPLVPLALALSGVPVLAVRLRRGRRLFAWRRGLAPLEREAGYFHHLLTDGGYAQEMRLYGHGPFCRSRFEAVRLRLRQARLAWRRYLVSRELAVQVLMLGVLAAVMLWLTGRLLTGALTLGGLVMAVQAMQRGQAQVGALAATIADIYQSALFFRTFEDLLALPARVTAPAVPQPLPQPVQHGIVFEHVSFAYPGTERLVLRDVSFVLRPNERLALVGVNGSGKSTLVKLLARLYDPVAGRILVDGIDLRAGDPAAWRRRIGVVFQDFGRYQLTAAENIWLGDPVGAPAAPRVAAAAAAAGLDETAHAWPQGLNTLLGRWLHKGTEPSVGQWQRIALARALLRDGDLLVLDEPTSALDARTQREVIARLRAMATGRMALVVSHRLALTDWADHVVVLRAGEVVETGTPAALRQSGGEFARLFAAGNEVPHEP